MGCATSGQAGNPQDAERSKQIDGELRRHKKELEKEIKLLLLGAGESGKSTIAKQMKILYLKGFTSTERNTYKEVVVANAVMAMRALVLAAQNFGIAIKPENQEHAMTFANNSVFFQTTMTPALMTGLTELWSDPGIRATLKRSSEFQLVDSSV
jgi:hypothetical protein